MTICVDVSVRWIQELEVTFKAFTGDLAKVDQAFGGVSPSVTPCKVGYDQGPDCSSQRPHEVSVRGPPYCEDIPCRQNGEDRGRRPGRPNCSLLKEPCAWHLRLRFYQVLDWQHRIFSYLYDDIVRWEPTRQLAWKDQISQGPWGRAETSSCGTSQFDGNLGALKEMTARSWRLHSRLLGGIHVSLRHMLFSLDARFLRAEFDVKRKVGGFTAAASPLIPKGTPTRYVSRVLKQALQYPQQYHSPSGCGKSLHEEIHKAATVGGGRGGYDQIFKRRPQKHGSSYTLCPQSITNRPTSAPEPAGPAVAMTEKAAPENSVHCNWVWALFKALGVGVFSGCAVLGAVADGIRALLWLYGRVHQLGIVLSAAGHVASEAANALWMILEEDWASSPFLLPQPLWGGGMRERGETPNKLTEADAEAQKLPRFAVSPPRFGSDCGGTLFKIVSDKHRSALATMSRNVAASLALLRIPATAHGRHFKCPENILSIWRKSRSASNSGQCSMNTGGAVYLSWLNHRTAAEEGQEAEGAELLGILPLILRHLRTASEEGEKLERSLRFTEEKVESFQNCTIARTSEDLPVQPSERDLHSEEPEQPLQATVSEPVQCFEIYTAVGQDSLTNKCRFQEEEGVKEAFAEGDPAVRERSQITLRELELRLKRKERERQCIPRVLKELSVVAADSADGCESGKAEDGAVVRLVTRGSGEVCSCSPPESPTTSRASSVGGDTQNDQEVVAPGSYVTGDLNAQEALHQGCVGVSPVQAKHTVLEALSQPQETCIFPDVDIIDNEQAAFRICREKFKGPSTRGVAFMPETLVTQSLMSQLRGVLKSQKRTHTVLTSTEASSGTHQGSNSVTFGDCIADEEWSACDVVEGPSCAGEIPTWVEAPSDSGDSGVVSPKGQGRSSMQYPDGGTTGESGCPVDGSPSCPSGNG